MKNVLPLLLLVVTTCLPTLARDRVLEIYSTLGTDAEVMMEVASSILGEDGRVIPDPTGGRLLVLAPPEKHLQLRGMFGQAAATAKNVQLTIQFLENQQQRNTGASLEGSVIIDSRGGTAATLRPTVYHQTTTTAQNTQQMLVTTSGREASLRIGESIPFFEWTVDYSRFHPLAHVGTRWQDVGAFLVFSPIIQPDGETILIRLTPEIRGRSPDSSREAYRFTTLQTQVMVRNGQTLQIGNWSEANTIYNTFLIGRSRQGRSTDLNIQITPRILP
jgi:type II secretory pathway component HofQ